MQQQPGGTQPVNISTPRTNDVTYDVPEYDSLYVVQGLKEVVAAGFARTLEHDLTEATMEARVWETEAERRSRRYEQCAATLAQRDAEVQALRAAAVAARTALNVAAGALLECSPCMADPCVAVQREWLDDALQAAEAAAESIRETIERIS
jgi:hypothetical protein